MLYLLFSGTTYIENEKYVSDNALSLAQKQISLAEFFQDVQGPSFFTPIFSAYPNQITCRNYKVLIKYLEFEGTLIQTIDNSKYTCMLDLDLQQKVLETYKKSTLSSLDRGGITFVIGSDSVPLLIPIKVIFVCNTEAMLKLSSNFPSLDSSQYGTYQTNAVSNLEKLNVGIKITTYSINQNIIGVPSSNFYAYMVRSVGDKVSKEGFSSQDLVEVSIILELESSIVYEQVFTIQEAITRIGVILAVFRIGIFLKFLHEKLFFKNIVKDMSSIDPEQNLQQHTSEDDPLLKGGQLNQTTQSELHLEIKDWTIQEVKNTFSFKTFLQLTHNVESLNKNVNTLKLNNSSIEKQIEQNSKVNDKKLQFQEETIQRLKEDLENMRTEMKTLNQTKQQLQSDIYKIRKQQEEQLRLVKLNNERIGRIENIVDNKDIELKKDS